METSRGERVVNDETRRAKDQDERIGAQQSGLERARQRSQPLSRNNRFAHGAIEHVRIEPTPEEAPERLRRLHEEPIERGIKVERVAQDRRHVDGFIAQALDGVTLRARGRVAHVRNADTGEHYHEDDQRGKRFADRRRRQRRMRELLGEEIAPTASFRHRT